MSSASLELYSGLIAAYDHFNRELFGGELPECLLTLAPKRNARGYFWYDVVKDREGPENPELDALEPGVMDEIALNPHTFRGRTEKEILSTLVHEMVHLWEHRCSGKEPPKRPTHTKEWAAKMKSVGLIPYNVKDPEKEHGRQCSHTIEEGGAFDVAYSGLAVSIDFAIVPALRRKKRERVRQVTVWCNGCDYKIRKPEESPDVRCTECDEVLGPKE